MVQVATDFEETNKELISSSKTELMKNLCSELGISRASAYKYLKYLNISAEGWEGKYWINSTNFVNLQGLVKHIKAKGSKKGFSPVSKQPVTISNYTNSVITETQKVKDMEIVEKIIEAPTKDASPEPTPSNIIETIYSQELSLVCKAIEAKQITLIIGESGSGKTTLCERVKNIFSTMKTSISQYQGSVKLCVKSIAEQLGIETTVEKVNAKGEVTGEKQMTVEEMKEEIIANCKANWLIIADDADLWPLSIRTWLMAIAQTGRVVLTAKHNIHKDIFLKALEIELPKPSEAEIRLIISQAAVEKKLPHTPRLVSELQASVGSNLALAKKAVIAYQIGIEQEPEHTQYKDITPFYLALLSLIAVVRFIGLGMGDRGLYIVGGISMTLFFASKYIGKGINQKQLIRGGRLR